MTWKWLWVHYQLPVEVTNVMHLPSVEYQNALEVCSRLSVMLSVSPPRWFWIQDSCRNENFAEKVSIFRNRKLCEFRSRMSLVFESWCVMLWKLMNWRWLTFAYPCNRHQNTSWVKQLSVWANEVLCPNRFLLFWQVHHLLLHVAVLDLLFHQPSSTHQLVGIGYVWWYST